MRRWYFEEMPYFRPEVGFETEFSVHVEGQHFVPLWKATEVLPERKLTYQWRYRGYDGDSSVTWELSEAEILTNTSESARRFMDVSNGEQNQRSRQSWETNARFWDKRMGEGNDFVNVLLWPAIERLLNPRNGERILDIACGNGLTSRRLARKGADVLAFDFSEEMIAIARERTEEPVDYWVIDATDREALLSLAVMVKDHKIISVELLSKRDKIPARAT